jgi:cellobiose phosphorylase
MPRDASTRRLATKAIVSRSLLWQETGVPGYRDSDQQIVVFLFIAVAEKELSDWGLFAGFTARLPK